MPHVFTRLLIDGARRLQQGARCRSGATLVEFSLLAFPFLLLLMATFEVGFLYWANQELENATGDAARMVRTGQVQAGNLNQAQLKTRTLQSHGAPGRLPVARAARCAQRAELCRNYTAGTA